MIYISSIVRSTINTTIRTSSPCLLLQQLRSIVLRCQLITVLIIDLSSKTIVKKCQVRDDKPVLFSRPPFFSSTLQFHLSHRIQFVLHLSNYYPHYLPNKLIQNTIKMSRISFDASHPSMHPSSPPSPQRKQFIPISPDRHKPKTILERAALLAPPTLSLNQTTTIDTTHRNLSNPSTPTKLNNINDNSTPTTDPRKFSVTNLDTGESFRIDHVPSTQAVEAQLDTFLNSEQEELIEAALQENDSNPNSEERKMNASPLAALYTKNETHHLSFVLGVQRC